VAEEQFSVQLLPAVQKQLERLPKRIRANVAARIDGMASNPRPQMAKPLKGGADLWRLRVGDYRIIYQINDRGLLVLVVDLGHRPDVYRGL
jgi:mRNA interferase RelE/StbE